MQLKLIYARARNGVIGCNNALPWHLPEDLAHFKRLTQGCPVIMGRATWDSLPQRFRPLPGRQNIVLTRQAQWVAKGAQPAHDLDAACALCPPASIVWVIGGAQLYALALPKACEVVATEIDADFAGDAFAPELGPQWQQTGREALCSSTGLPFAYVTYRRRPTLD